MYPFFDYDNARFPIKGGLLQRRGGTVRHDAVAWGYARGADSRGVDIIQRCEVTGIRTAKGKVVGVETNRGFIKCKKLGLAAAGNSSEVAAMAGMKLPIESHVLQAFVSEGLKPYHRRRRHLRRRPLLRLAVRQGRPGLRRRHRRLQFLCPARQPADGRACDRGRRRHDPQSCPGARAALLGRHHGHVDGWLADHRQDPYRRSLSQRRLVLRRLQGHARLGLVLRPYHRQGRTPPLNAAYRLDRFRRGYMLDEKGQGATPNLH